MTTIIKGKFSPIETTGNHLEYQKYDFTATNNGGNYSMTIFMNENVLGKNYLFENNNRTNKRNITQTKDQISFNITEKEFSRLKQPDSFHVFSKKKV